MELPNGVFMTMMPLAVAAFTSMLSTPMPARPTTLSLVGRGDAPSRSPWWRSARRGRRSPPMIFSSSSLERPTLTSVASPRSLEDGDGGGRKLIGDENAGGHDVLPGRMASSRIRESGISGTQRLLRHASWVPGRAARARNDRSTPPWRGRPWLRRRPSRARASAPRDRPSPPCEPHQMRRYGGASRWPAMSRAAFSLSRIASSCLTNARCASIGSLATAGSTIFRHTEVLERVAGSTGEVLEPRRALGPVVEHLGVGIGAGAAAPSAPPMLSAQASASR